MLPDTQIIIGLYYVEKSHEPIIVPDEWEAVQEELARRKTIGRSYSGKSVLGAKIRCGDCGSWYGEKVWHSTDSYRCRVWQCNGKYDKKRPRCETPVLREEDIKQRFLAAFNSLIADKEAYIAACEATRAVLTDTATIDAEIKELLGEMEIVAGLTKKCIDENSRTAQDQDDYAERYNSYVERYEKAKARYDQVIAALQAQVNSFQTEMDLAVRKAVDAKQQELSDKDREIVGLQTKLDNQKQVADADKDAAVHLAEAQKDKALAELQGQIAAMESEHARKEAELIADRDRLLRLKDEELAQYKEMKARLSTKMVGESLEQHCETEFNKVRALGFPRALFEKDNDARGGSKGDYVFRDYDESGAEYISIMFEMKNEMDETATKHRNEDFFKKLDAARVVWKSLCQNGYNHIKAKPP